MMIAAGGIAVFAHRGAPKLATPNDKGIIQQTAFFEVFHQRGLALIHLAADFLEIPLQVFAGPPWLSQLVW